MTTAELMLALIAPALNEITLRDAQGKLVTGNVLGIELESGSTRRTFCNFNVTMILPWREKKVNGRSQEVRTIYVRTEG